MQGIAAVSQGSPIGSIVHGTTVGTNSLLERRGPKVGVITTRGFRDVLEMRRRDRRQTWGLWGDFTPVVDRDFRLEVDERTLADGSIRQPVDVAQVRDAARACARKAPRRWRSFSSMPMPIPKTSGRLWPRPRRSGTTNSSRPRIRCCRKSGNSSAPRPPRSTVICSRSSAAISASWRRARRAAIRWPVLYRAVEWRRDVDRDRAALSGSYRVVGTCGRRHRRRQHRADRPATTMSSPAISAAPRSMSRSSSAARRRWRHRPRSISAW